MINAHIIGSGSKGNATIIYSKKTIILIDLGVDKSMFLHGLDEIGLNVNDIDFAFFTHNHTDHIKNFSLISREKRYGLVDVCGENENNELENYTKYNFKDFKITPLKTSHDGTKGNCGYLIECDGESLVYLTDSGKLTKKTLKLMKNATYYIIESNHDTDMLYESSRPIFLKNRIHGLKGHLSNDESAHYLSTLIGNNTKEIILAHLSEECNTEEKALKTYKEILLETKVDLSKIILKCAKQYESVDL